MTSCHAVIAHLGLLGAAGAGLGQGQEAGQRGQGDQGHQQQVIHLNRAMVLLILRKLIQYKVPKMRTKLLEMNTSPILTFLMEQLLYQMNLKLTTKLWTRTMNRLLRQRTGERL